MKVTIDVPDDIFIGFIENVEKKQNVKLTNVRKLIDNIKEYYVRTTPADEDMSLYKWVGALAFDDLTSKIMVKKD